MNNKKKIEKKIHYCWLGGNEKSELVIRCIRSWEKYAPDYEIIEWNEKNFNFENSNQYVREAMQNEKWAFVTDYMRLSILYNEGGIYLDTDVELRKPLDDLLNNKSFIGVESLNTICTAVIGSQRKVIWIEKLLEKYDGRVFVKSDGSLDLTPNSKYIYEFLCKEYNFKNNTNTNCLADGLIVYPAEYFSPKNYLNMKINITDNTYAIHHYGGMWKSNWQKGKDYILALITRIIGEENRERIRKIIRSE